MKKNIMQFIGGGVVRLEKRRKENVAAGKLSGKGLALGAAVIAVLGGIVLGGAMMGPSCTYVMTDGERYETIELHPGSVEEACRKAGFRNMEVVNREDGDGVIYLTLEETFDVSVQTSEGAFSVRTVPCTVGELLEKNGITVGASDLVSPDMDSWLSDSSQIQVTRVTYQTETEVEPIPFSVEMQYDAKMLKGQQEIVQYGANGEKAIEYRIELHDGEEKTRQIVSEREEKQPVNCIIRQGTQEMRSEQEEQEPQKQQEQQETTAPAAQEATGNPLPQTTGSTSGELSTAGRSQVWSVPAGIDDDTENKIITAGDGSTFAYSAVIDVTATAYHRVEDGGEITASGTVTQYGTIAVDPRVIPLGSKLYVVSDGGDQSWSYGPGLAEDTGGLIKGAKIDLFFMTGNEANDFGVRPAKVYILKD